ncbi:MAG: methyltransferase domain-containing protein [Deltaproteobacteria bacterium]|nr:methyltransferase domain-containing protein [Deltaproteobacteria bacterium]
MTKRKIAELMIIAFLFAFAPLLFAQGKDQVTALDKKAQAFLDGHRGKWHDMNIPEVDGKLLYDIIIKNRYTKALEIGTSTGHSAIWIAWALSKTGGKLITVEIDESRHKTALENFKKAGLSEYIDARLADAHEFVPRLKGPFDFVFSDADKDWYKNYFDAVAPKLVVGGCYVTHNVSDRRRGYFGLSSYADYLKSLKNFETTFDDRGAGVAISFKKSEQ